ncbi:Deoxyribonuclease NucA/NucB [Pseudonocardia oroxyli]|uniref:Deoxyribonuclease NucA/NucB n=2 Tax=Pseudonocardia oroxyli TaxID=366584 RepID=A0A1G7WY47_PSEOR|nr:Deoxyribonuclease NucA/NucB [Pseudonocardia oroxyli]
MTTDVASDRGGALTDTNPVLTEACTRYAQTGYSVCGAIRDKYLALGGPGRLGYPTSNELTNPDGVGKRNTFQNGGSSIYWHPSTGAWQIGGEIFRRWGALGYENGVLGYPTSDELTNPDGVGKRNTFQRASGHIYWSPATGAWSIQGEILRRWAALGYERGRLGYPTSDELTNPDGLGRRNTFQNAGAHIYWSPGTGAWSIQGGIIEHWAALGWERGVLGYPTTDETPTPDGIGAFNHFANNGSIYWTGATGSRAVYGPIRDKWSQLGWERSCHGYPTSDVSTTATGQRSTFQRGTIDHTSSSNATVSSCEQAAAATTLYQSAREAAGLPDEPELSLQQSLDEEQVHAYAAATNRSYPSSVVVGRDVAVEHEPGGDGVDPNFLLERDFVEECRANANDLSHPVASKHGWVKNHFEWCAVGKVSILNGFGQTVASARLTRVGYSTNTTAFVWMYYLVDQVTDESVFSDPGDYSITFATECGEDTGTGDCREDTQPLPYESLTAWAARSDVDATLPPVYQQLNSSNATSNPSADARRQHFIRTTISTGDTGRPVKDTKSTGVTPLRCDSSNEFPTYTEGCVFNNVVPFLTYSIDGNVRSVAEHIRDAQTRPEITDPRVAGKTIPGAFGSETYLRRTRDGSLADANGRAAAAVCRQVDPDYVNQGFDCDEYPFRSTREGASTTQNFSARALDRSENRRAGNGVRIFYRDDRILDGDRFQVRIIDRP